MKNEFAAFFKNVSTGEFESFGLFLSSPYFRVPNRISALYRLIAKRNEGFKNCSLTREDICRNFYSSGSPASGEINTRKLISDFRKYFHQFAAQTGFDNNKTAREEMGLEWYRRKNDRKNYLRHSERLIDYINENHPKDDSFYLELLQVHRRRYEFLESSVGEIENDPAFLINTLLDKFFAASKLLLFHRFRTMEYICNMDLSGYRTFGQPVMEYVKQNEAELKENDPEVYLRYLALGLQSEDSGVKEYEDFITALFSFDNRMNINDNGFLFTVLSQLSLYINRGKNEYIDKVIELAEIMNERRIFRRHGLTIIDLRIIAECALASGKTRWAYRFIESVKEFIKDDDPGTHIELIIAKLNFYDGNLDEALNRVLKLESGDFLHFTDARLLELRISLLKEDYLKAEDLISTVKKYLKAHFEIGVSYKKSCSKFLDYAHSMVNILSDERDPQTTGFELTKLLEKVNTAGEFFYGKAWLSEHITDLLKKKI